MSIVFMLNRKFFFDRARLTLFDGKLLRRQVAGLAALLDYWEKHYEKGDDRWLAYVLATVHHETDRTFQPIEEYGKGRGKLYGMHDQQTGKMYYGRGFVQITWKANYAKLSRVIGEDLVVHPEKALELGIATKILFEGMVRGLFTGKKLGDYFNAKSDSWMTARRIVNGTDKARLISSYALRYYEAISY